MARGKVGGPLADRVSGQLDKVSGPLADGAAEAAARVSATARAGSARVTHGAQTLGDYLRDQRRGARLSLRQLADQAGVSNPYLSQIERGLRRPSADVLQQIAKALRISAETLYIRAGILDSDEAGQRSVQLAVLNDPDLTERQRHVLLDIYQSFRRENDANAELVPDLNSIPTTPIPTSPARKPRPRKEHHGSH